MDRKSINQDKLRQALSLLHEQMLLHDAPHTELVVCGGSALIAANLVPRTTRDVDIVALMQDGTLMDSEPLPPHLLIAAEQVGEMLNLPDDWLNNGPASQFRMGLPEGFSERLQCVDIGEKLSVHFISRTDQIYFKLFASVDRGGYHITDLKALQPSAAEIEAAARWCIMQDVSDGFRFLLNNLLEQLGYAHVCTRL